MTNSALRVFSIVWVVACIVTGEVRVVPQAAGPVAQVALNRYDLGWGWDGWNAIADEPEPWAWDAAWDAWRNGPQEGGNLYAISEADIVKLGFDKGGWENVGNERWPEWVGRIWE